MLKILYVGVGICQLISSCFCLEKDTIMKSRKIVCTYMHMLKVIGAGSRSYGGSDSRPHLSSFLFPFFYALLFFFAYCEFVVSGEHSEKKKRPKAKLYFYYRMENG